MSTERATDQAGPAQAGPGGQGAILTQEDPTQPSQGSLGERQTQEAPSKGASARSGAGNESDAEEGDAGKKRKRVVLFGYSGAGYSGLQTQQGGAVHLNENDEDDTPDTIEDELFQALKKAGAISEANSESFQKIGWTRSARTDRGVHAAAQVICAKLQVPGKELPERGNDVSKADESAFVERVNSFLPAQIRVYRIFRVNKGFNARRACDSRSYGYFLPEMALGRSDGTLPSEFELRQALKCFEGSHTFHNFTEKLGPKDPRARRVIESFTCSEVTEVVGGVRVFRLQVKGQSFLKHHIRRMVGYIVECLRRRIDPAEVIPLALSSDRVLSTRKANQSMPMAPAEGLFLDVAHFEGFNENLSSDKQEPGRERIDFVHDSIARAAREHLINEVILAAVFSNGPDGAMEAFKKWIVERDTVQDFPPCFDEVYLPIEILDANEFLRTVEKNRVKRLKGDWRSRTDAAMAIASSSSLEPVAESS